MRYRTSVAIERWSRHDHTVNVSVFTRIYRYVYHMEQQAPRDRWPVVSVGWGLQTDPAFPRIIHPRGISVWHHSS